MAFDKTFPVPTTKIRDLSTGIPNNWDAIEGADATFKPEGLNLNNRTPLAVANDPTAIAEAIITYCKDDGSGDPQMYAIDPDSTISQLTPMLFTAAANGKMTIAGITFIWGQTTGTTGAKVYHTPFGNNIFNLQITPIAVGAEYGAFKNPTKTGFDWTAGGTISAIQYFGIGN